MGKWDARSAQEREARDEDVARERERERFGRQCDAWVMGGHEQ
jgi:hypothetical protein